MKIVQVSSSEVTIPFEKGEGPLQVIFNISKQFAVIGHEVTILSRGYSSEDQPVEYTDGLRIIRLKARQVPISRLPKILRAIHFILAEINIILYALRVSKYLKEENNNIDVLHLHSTSLGVMLITLNRKFRTKTFYTCHVGNWVLPRNSLSMIERVALFLDSYLMRRVRKVIALNDLAREQLTSAGKVKADNVVVMQNGVDTELFNPTIDVEETRKRHGLERKLTVLFVGWLIKLKGIEYLIKAADIIVNVLGYKNTLFLLVGSFRSGGIDKNIDMKEVLNFISQRQLDGNIIFTGALPIEDVRALYVAADIFVFPSLAESGPLVTLEAMSSGKPIVGTKVGDIPRQVRDGWNGFLVDPADERQLADKIKYLIDHPEERERMGANSRKYAEEEFDWKKVAEKLLQVYQN